MRQSHRLPSGGRIDRNRPLRFTFERPELDGFFGWMFDVLMGFDKPFNQAPSLHVALTVILIARYQRLLPPRAFALFLAWSVLVVASVMTTFQHHFIDIPTGALLGWFCVWCWPMAATTRMWSPRTC